MAQDAVMELSEHGIVLSVEESGCLQAKVFLKREVSRDAPAPACASGVCVYASARPGL
jgi:hypothetical protein